jgi:acyl-CoA thioesterase-2
MSASFQLKQKGVEHQIPMPNLIPPQKLISDLEQLEEMKKIDPERYNRFKKVKPEVIEFRPVEKMNLIKEIDSPAESNFWFRSREETKFEMALQQQLLAYISDFWLLRTASLPHRKELSKSKTFFASIDHAIWFHRDFKMQDWHLYSMESPSASNSRGFSRGSIFNKDGVLIASTAQEGLMRQI